MIVDEKRDHGELALKNYTSLSPTQLNDCLRHIFVSSEIALRYVFRFQ